MRPANKIMMVKSADSPRFGAKNAQKWMRMAKLENDWRRNIHLTTLDSHLNFLRIDVAY
jgi:hypothetical protein